MFPPISLVHPQQRYLRMPPRLLEARSQNGELLAWFYKHLADREARCPPHGYIQLDGCYVYEGAYVLTEEDGWLKESVVDYAARDDVLPLLLDLISRGHFRTMDTDGLPVVLIASAGYGNYGHVITDVIPKLLNVQRAGWGEIILALPEAMTPFLELIQIIIGQLGISARTMLWPRAGLFRLENTFFVAPIGKHSTTPPPTKSPDIHIMRDIVLGAYGAKNPSSSSKLFVARRESEGRQIANLAEIAAILDDFGFETVYPADLSLPAQVRLFARASHIIGGLGAGLANIIYASPATKVMMIDPGLADLYFWDLASSLGQQFTWVFAGEIAHWSLELARKPFEVKPVLLRAALEGF